MTSQTPTKAERRASLELGIRNFLSRRFKRDPTDAEVIDALLGIVIRQVDRDLGFHRQKLLENALRLGNIIERPTIRHTGSYTDESD